MNSRPILGVLLLLGASLLQAERAPDTLHGTCTIGVGEDSDRADLSFNRSDCEGRQCGHNHMDEPWSLLSGITLDDLRREGAHADAVVSGEAGKLTCSGTIHDMRLSGDYTFVPDSGFVSRMDTAGFRNLDAEKLEAYVLFGIKMSWIESLQRAGISGLTSDNLIALRIFKADADYVHSLAELGYPSPPADKLIALRVQGVNPTEVKQVRAMGLQPDLDELIQMRIFKVTPDFIQRMRDRGINDLTIAKLVKIRIFDLAE